MSDQDKIMCLADTITEMRKEMLNPPAADKKIYKKVDESCKYSPLRNPIQVMNGYYSFATFEQMYGNFMNYRFKHYLGAKSKS